MRFTPRTLIGVLLVLLGTWVGVRAALAQDPPPAAAAEEAAGPDSPRALFEGFLRAMNDATKRGRPSRMADAVALLDLSDLPEAERAARGRERALALKDVLDFHGRLEIGDLPDAAAAGARPDFTLATDQGPVRAVPLGGRWVFAAETLGRVQAMRAAFEAAGAERYEVFSLRSHVPASLRGRALWLHHWQWLGFVLLFLLAWLAHRVTAFFAHLGVSAFLRRKGWGDASTKEANRAGRPVGLFAAAAVVVGLTPLLELPIRPVNFDATSIIVGKFLASLGAVLICYRLADVAGAKMAEAAARTESRLDDQLVPLVRKSIKILVTAAGMLFILDNLEVNITSLVTGLGVAGLGVAFAAQDTIANLFGSVTVFLDKPFQVGDWIQVAGQDGTVEEVGFRSTRVRTFYDSLVSIPNSKVANNPVDNYGRRRFRRFRTVVGVLYDTPPERIEAFCEGIRAIVRANERMRQDVFHVYLNDWGPSSLDILVYVFFDVPNWAEELRERQNFMLEVIRLADALGVGFAFPTRTIHVESTPERPLPPPGDTPLDAMDAVVRRFGKGGDLSRPHGRGSGASPPPKETP